MPKTGIHLTLGFDDGSDEDSVYAACREMNTSLPQLLHRRAVGSDGFDDDTPHALVSMMASASLQLRLHAAYHRKG